MTWRSCWFGDILLAQHQMSYNIFCLTNHAAEWTFICGSFRHIWNYWNECNCKLILFHCFIEVSVLSQRQDRGALEVQEAAERRIFARSSPLFCSKRPPCWKTHTSGTTTQHRTTTMSPTTSFKWQASGLSTWWGANYSMYSVTWL